MKTFLHPAAGTLALRLALGAVFLAHGAFKFFVLSLAGTAEFFVAHGYPGWTAYPVFAVEIVAGTMLVAGFGTRWAALALVPISIGALLVHVPNGWYFGAPNGGGWEYAAFLIVALFTQASLGDGALALSSLRERKSSGTEPRVCASAP